MSFLHLSYSESPLGWASRVSRGGLLALVFAAALSAHAQTAASSSTEAAGLRVITDLDVIWQTTGDDRDRAHPAKFELLIDYYDPDWKMVWGRAGGRGFYFASGDKPLPIETGRVYEVECSIIPNVGLTLADSRLTPLPGVSAPASIEATQRLGDFTLQNQLVEIEGVVQRQALADSRHLSLELLVGNTIVHCRVLIAPGAPVPDLQDAQIRATGVYIAEKTPLGQLAMQNLWVQSLDRIVPVSLNVKDDRFLLPLVSIDNLPRLPTDGPVRVSGAVHSSEPGKSVSLRDYSGQVKVLTTQTRPLRIGEYVEAVGIPSVNGNDWFLRNGYFRLTGSIEIDPKREADVRLVDRILAMRPEEAGRGQQVKLTGVITWIRGSTDYFYFQDPTGGIRVKLPQGKRGNREMLYSLVEVVGVTAAGKFAPEVVATEVTALGQNNFPVARHITLEHAMTGVEASQWVEMRGYLRAVAHEPLWTRLSLIGGSGEFIVQVPKHEPLSELVGAHLRVTGVCVVEANERRELTGITLLAPNHEAIQVEEPAPKDPFAVPERTIASLRQFSPLQSFTRRARLVGQVVHHVSGRYIYIQDGESGLLALTRGTEPLQPGDRVELSGLAGREGNRLVLRECIYRRIGAGVPPLPLELPAENSINENFDGRLVAINGRLVEVSRRASDVHFLVQSGAITFEARIENALLTLPTAGSELRLTGVYQVELDEYRQARDFHLLLRSEADFQVLSQPSWWTARRALYAAALLFACVLGIIGWVTILRRRVKQQTSQLRDQLEKEALLEARHRDIIDNASDFIFTLDHDGRLTSFNPAGERMTGLTRAAALGRSFHDLLAPDDSVHPLPIFALRSENDPAVTCQTRFKTADGRIIWVEICARALRQPGLPHGLLGVARDISERKQIEEELRRARDAAEANTRAKSAFLANMSHEIRTPMNGVIGMSNLLLDTRLSDEQRDFAETIRNSAESLLTVLNDILDFSKIEAGKLQFETIDFDLHETVESTLELLAARASDKGLELASYLPTELPRWIRGDPGRLRQVLLNLIGNAIKFTEKGEVVVAVAMERETDEEVRLHFEVTDTGPGLDSETQARLFQPFSQADGSTTRKFGGTGLGLAISKQIVHLMEGQIGVRSTLGHGATFWFTVRLDKQPYGTPHEPPPRVTALSGLRALIVDDNNTNRKILQHYCAAWGLRAEPVVSATDALKVLRDAAHGDPFQLVLTDYQMPEMDGLSLAREIQNDSRISGARVVLLTSWDRRFDREELNACGVIRMLVKPIRQQDLLGALLRCVRIGFGTNSGGSNLPSRSTPPAEEPAPRAQNGRSLRILIAEDNIVNQRVASLQLRNLGHTVEIAANGLEVLKALETSTYDVIFMDGQMPELDGYQTTRRIRQDPATSGVRIIAMTANAMQGDRERCLEAGMDDYISKPTRPEDLQAALVRCSLHHQTPTPFQL
jgi:PAS domain S-box-containing protein